MTFPFSRKWDVVILTGILTWVILFTEVTSQSNHDSWIPASEFSIDNSQHLPCLLIKINATIIIEHNKQRVSVEVPSSAEAKGRCGNGFESQIEIFWNTFKLLWHFQKTRVSDAWYVDAIQLTYNTSDKAFQEKFDSTGPGFIEFARTPVRFVLWLTPIGESYTCSINQQVKIGDSKNPGWVTIFVRRIQIQPFAELTRYQYGEEHRCPDIAVVDDKNNVIQGAVSNLPAIVVLLSLIGYAQYRFV